MSIALVLLHAGLVDSIAATAEKSPESRRATPSWGAIAARPGGYGYSFNHRSQAAAEQSAREQCERATARPAFAAPPSACAVRTAFERSCAALVTGNFGEWGVATASTKEAASTSAIAECNGHLPTEPCKLVVSVCSPG